MAGDPPLCQPRDQAACPAPVVMWVMDATLQLRHLCAGHLAELRHREVVGEVSESGIAPLPRLRS